MEEAGSGPPSLLIPATPCPASEDLHVSGVRTQRQKEKLRSKTVSAEVGQWDTLPISLSSTRSHLLNMCG